MSVQAIKDQIPTSPAFVLDENGFLDTLDILSGLRQQSGCKLLYSIKSLPLSTVLDTARLTVDGFAVSSLFEAQLADEALAGRGSIHLTTPGIRPDEINAIAGLCTHISFNSLTQHQRFAPRIEKLVSAGLRVNPKLSFLNDDRFNPCRKYSKLGVDMDVLWQSSVLDEVQGLHIHNVFSATDYTPLIKTLEKLTLYLGDKLAKLDWLNLGGGYLLAQMHDHRPFIAAIDRLKSQYALDVYIEPGKAVVDRCGYLLTTVIDSFASDGKTIAVLDTSVNHHPEVFEYQRQPALHEHDPRGAYQAILAGSTCLAGDVFGEYRFAKPLQCGDRLVFTHLGAYSLVKANRFNGYNLPDIYLYNAARIKRLKHYTYQDYRRQWLAD
ncbi:MAG: carboxynorspermidine decarboxylase [Methylovulum sp.]|nr:carboxynorspermidine decarboxylase [Methylovulum sp.]